MSFRKHVEHASVVQVNAQSCRCDTCLLGRRVCKRRADKLEAIAGRVSAHDQSMQSRQLVSDATRYSGKCVAGCRALAPDLIGSGETENVLTRLLILVSTCNIHTVSALGPAWTN